MVSSVFRCKKAKGQDGKKAAISLVEQGLSAKNRRFRPVSQTQGIPVFLHLKTEEPTDVFPLVLGRQAIHETVFGRSSVQLLDELLHAVPGNVFNRKAIE